MVPVAMRYEVGKAERGLNPRTLVDTLRGKRGFELAVARKIHVGDLTSRGLVFWAVASRVKKTNVRV